MKPLIIAHRGFSSLAPENTLSAFQLAIDEKVDFIECDIQFTADEVAVLFHDDFLDRTTNYQKQLCSIHHLTFTELQKLDAGEWFSKNFNHEKIPLLKDLLLLDDQTGLMLEIKQTPLDPNKIVKVIKKEIEQSGSKKVPIFLATSDRAIFKVLIEQCPLNEIMGIADSYEQLDYFIDHNISFIAVNYLLIDEKIMQKIPDKTHIWAWTVDQEKDALRLVACGVEGIISNEPSKMKSAFNIK